MTLRGTIVLFAAFSTTTAHSTEVKADKPAPELRLMTFNIRYGTANDGPNRWPNRNGLVIDVIRESAPDILGLQEALDFQIQEILDALPGYERVGVGRDDGESAGEFSPILFRADRFELLDSGTFWLSDTPERIASTSWGNAIPRICTWARLRDRSSGQCVDIYNTHFDHRSAPSRFRSAALIARRIAERSEPVPVVLMGDLNAGESSDPLRFLRGEIQGPDGEEPLESGFVDTFRLVHPEAENVGTFHGFSGEPGRDKIDDILIQPGGFEVLDAAILRASRDGRYPSDHFPVTARLRPLK